MMITRKEVKHESLRIKRDSFRFTMCNCWSKDGCSFWIWIASFILSWKLVEVWSKRGSYLLNTKCNNVQNLADAWKCERPCQWLSALLHVWKNGGTFHRCNRHYSKRIQTCKPHMNGVHQGQGHRQLLMNMRFAVIFVLLCIPLQCGRLCHSRKNSSFAKLFAKKYSVSRSD